MLEQWFSWLLPILQFLEPYLSKLQSVSFLVLGFGALLLLAALIGGGFKIQSVEIPRIGNVARALSGSLGVLSVSVFFSIPPEIQTLDLIGEVVFQNPPSPEDALGIRLYRIDNPVEAIISNGRFEFRAPANGVQAGLYRAEIYSDQGTLDDLTVSVARKGADREASLVLSQGPYGEFIAASGDPIQHLVNLSKRKDWQYRAVAIDQLNRLARADVAIRNDLIDRMKSGTPDSQAAAFALAESCDTQNRDVLAFMQRVWSEKQPIPYQRVRALASLLCDGAQVDLVKQELFKLVKHSHHLFAEYPRAATQGVPNMAAYYLTLAGERRSCLLGELLKGIESPYKIVRDRSFEALNMFVGHRIVSAESGQFRDWLGQYMPKLDDC